MQGFDRVEAGGFRQGSDRGSGVGYEPREI